jgi:hypothetical protein
VATSRPPRPPRPPRTPGSSAGPQQLWTPTLVQQAAAPPPPPPPKQGGKVGNYLTSSKNIAGSVGALAGLGLFFAGIVAPPLWPVVVGGLYGIGALLAPGRKRNVDLRTDMDTKDLSKSLDGLLRRIHGRLPRPLEAKVQGIAATIQGILPRSGEFAPGSQELFILQRTVTDYLPTSLEAFMTLPRTYAALKPLRGTKTAEQVLADQLDLLQQQMNEVADAIARNDADKLLAQGRFLEEKFGRSDLSIDPDAPGAGLPAGGGPQGSRYAAP